MLPGGVPTIIGQCTQRTPLEFTVAKLCLFVCLFVLVGVFFFFLHFYFPASGQAVFTGVVPPPPRFLPSFFIAHRVVVGVVVLLLFSH